MGNEKLKGLTEDQALQLQKEFGLNALPEKNNFSVFSILLEQFKSPLIYILLFAASISLIFKEYTDLYLIVFVISFNAIIGFYQEYSAQKTLTALRKILKPKAVVMREGQRKEIDIQYLVPGDLVELVAGDKIPADGKLIDGANLLVNESILTGETEPIGKNGEKENLLFMGTSIVAGKGLMEVTKTGIQTEIGKIGQSLLTIKEEKTPLQIKLEKFSQKLAYIVGVICVFIFIVGIFHQSDIWQGLKVAVVLAVAAIPEGLPIAVTVILSLGMKRILKRQGLVRKLLSVETLGATSVICTDKTGTLTKGVMEVVKTNFKDKEKMLWAMVLANQQKDGLEVSLWEYVKKQNLFDPNQILGSTQKSYEEPFDSEKKHSLVIVSDKKEEGAYILGAPELVLQFCKIDETERKTIEAEIEKWAEEGLKIIAGAYKNNGKLVERKDYSWLGLVGIADPIRPEVKEAITACKRAGIKIKIITGDYRKTAENVAMNLGLTVKPENVLEGSELEQLSDEELQARIEKIILFTRTTPHQKLKIINALQANGEVVAMTGDGVNDALALKKANIAVVVENATEVAKEAADLILLDSNFGTIVAAVEEGRLILANIKKVIGYVLSNSFAEIILIFGAMVLDLPAALTVVMILWIQLICDGFPDIVLSFEGKERSLMEISPKQIQKEGILDKSILFLIVAISTTIGALSLGLYWFVLFNLHNLALAQTIAFATVASASLIYIFSFKNLHKPLIKTENFFQNKYLFVAVVYGFTLICLAIYTPFFNRVLGTVPLELKHWLAVIGIGFVAIFWIEVTKVIKQMGTTHHLLKASRVAIEN